MVNLDYIALLLRAIFGVSLMQFALVSWHVNTKKNAPGLLLLLNTMTILFIGAAITAVAGVALATWKGAQ